MLRIDSPGGTTAGSEAVYDAVRKISARKPVVAVMDTVAASGGYITALAADRIVARGNTITGSIGVIFASFGFPELMARQGVERRVVTAGRSKSFADPFLPQKPEDVERVTRLIKINEYKRRQAPVGIRITHRAFGRDWRYPITNRFS